MRRAVILGGIGRSGTSIVRDMVHTSPDAFSFGTLELKFFAEMYGLLDLYRALVTDYRVDRAGSALKDFQTVMTVHMTDPDFYGQDSILSCFPKGEKKYRAIVSRFAKALGGNRQYALPVTDKAFWDCARAMLDSLIKLAGGNGKSVFVEKTPHNVFNTLPFERLFDSPKFVWVIRDPVQIAASLLKMPWGPNDFGGACEWVEAAYSRFFAVQGSVPALVLKYEWLLAHPNEAIAKLEKHTGLTLVGAASLLEEQYKTPPEPEREVLERLSALQARYKRFPSKVAP